jgi:hypothetical protein
LASVSSAHFGFGLRSLFLPPPRPLCRGGEEQGVGRAHHPSQCPRHRPSFTDSAHHPPVFSLAPADCRGSLTPLYCPWCEAHYTFLGRSNHCLRAPTNNSCPGTSTYMCVVSGTSLGRSNHCQLSPQVRQHNKSFNINQLQSDPICSSQHPQLRLQLQLIYQQKQLNQHQHTTQHTISNNFNKQH